MRRACYATVLIVAALWVSTSGQTNDVKLRDGDAAWDAGNYPEALTMYLSLLASAEGERLLEPIALQTGELFQTIELTPDGGTPRFAPDGRHLTYEVGRGVSRRTRLAHADAPATPIAELPGYGASFAPDARNLAYLALAVTPEMREIEASVEVAPAGAERNQRTAALARLVESASRVVVRDLTSGAEREVELPNLRKNAVVLGANGAILFTGSAADGADQVYLAAGDLAPKAITDGEPGKVLQEINAPGTAALFTHRAQGGRGAGAAPPRFGVVSLPEGTITMVGGSAPAFSGDGLTLAYVTRAQDLSQLMVGATASPASAAAIRSGSERVDEPALSRDGGQVAFQLMPKEDWELYLVNRDGSGERRVTREIQHDILPRFLGGPARLLGMIGEPRHRRSYVYDLSSNTRTRVFHNNTVRTIAPEYEWIPSPDGTRLLIVAERDGDTVSAARGVYLTDLSARVTAAQLRSRLQASLDVELALRTKGKRLFAPLAADVARVVADTSVSRIYGYEKALFDFDSKHVSRPGNKLASTYLFDTYKSFGYSPEYQWFAGRGALGGQTANVVATLPGTVNPELVYVVSSHYDSVMGGPGADDDSSGTAALLEAARVLAKHPQPATIVFASFTGEESGLLGSREFVRRAVAAGTRVVGALNNDMIGWTNDHRLDNTIRYSNPGIRDVQHAAAMQFTNLITYDALYFKSTDAHAYYEAYGDIVGGIGSYPVLGNPHYHQPHDLLDTINHQLVAEVSKTTTATLMLLASSPSRIEKLTVDGYLDGSATLSWTPSPEKGVTAYLVAWGPPERPEAQQMKVTKPAAAVKAPAGTIVSVKAVTERGLEGWDWARVTLR